MPEKGPFSLVTSDRHIRRRVGALEAIATAELCELYKDEVQPAGSILLVLERSNIHRDDTIRDYKSEALRDSWRMRTMQISRQEMIYLQPDLNCSVSWADVAAWLTRLSEPASKPVTILEWSDEMQGAYCGDFRIFPQIHVALSPGKNLNSGINIRYHYLFIGPFTLLPQACAL